MLMSCSRRLANAPYTTNEKFIRWGYPIPGSIPLNCVVESGFSTNPQDKVIMGGTVTFANLQIAYYMGFETILIVGLDHNYHKYEKKKAGSTFIADGDDDAHFYPEYFDQGGVYNAPELDAVDRISFATARRVFEGDGRKIINLTKGSKALAFEFGDVEEWL